MDFEVGYVKGAVCQLLLLLASVRDEWMSRSIGGMILTGENWSIGRKTLYNVGGRWMNEYGTLVEWYWQGKAEELPRKPCLSAKFFIKPHAYRRGGRSLVSWNLFYLLLLFMMSVFILPFYLIYVSSFLSIPCSHCPDWYSCAQTESAEDWEVFLCYTSTLSTLSIYFFISINFTTRTVIRLHGFEWFVDFEEWMVKNVGGSVRDKPYRRNWSPL
jgi:hypothetical protein